MHAHDLVPPHLDEAADRRPRETSDNDATRAAAAREDQVPSEKRPDFLTVLLRALAPWSA